MTTDVPALDEGLAEAVLAAVDSRRDAILGLAQELVATPSITPPGDTTTIVARLLEHMGEAGLAGARSVGPDALRRSLTWERTGDGSGPRLLLAGHIDTKPIGDRDAWAIDPFDPVIRNGELHGLGASDMKAAVAAMVHAASVVSELVPAPRGDIALLFTADEEGGMRDGAIHLVETGQVVADAVVIGEPAGIHHDWEQLDVASRGLSTFTVELRGTQMHSSLADVLPSRNASLDLARALLRFADLSISAPPHPLCPQGVTVNAGALLSGGSSFGTCSGLSSFGVDVRFPPGVDRSAVERGVEALVGQLRAEDPKLRLSWSFSPAPNDYMEPTEVAVDHPVVRAAQDACRRVLGSVPPLGTFPGATEARVYQGIAGIPTLPAFGPGCLPVCHSPNERVSVEAVHEAARIYALLLATAATHDGSWAIPA